MGAEQRAGRWVPRSVLTCGAALDIAEAEAGRARPVGAGGLCTLSESRAHTCLGPESRKPPREKGSARSGQHPPENFCSVRAFKIMESGIPSLLVKPATEIERNAPKLCFSVSEVMAAREDGRSS